MIPIIFSILVTACAGQKPVGAGISENPLAPCPKSPNCVSSMAHDEKHFIHPIAYNSDSKTAYDAMLKVLSDQPRMTIVEQVAGYLHIEFKSKLFGFVDDVEFYFPGEAPVIHVRSASRVGYSDLGVNRKRIERLRALFDKTLAAVASPLE